MDVHSDVVGSAGGTGVACDSDDPILDRLSELVESEAALDLRIGEVLAQIEAFGVLPLGHTSFRGFLDNDVDLDRSWAIRLKLFATSPLEEVKVAMCRNVIPTSAALEADREMTVEDQRAYIEGVNSGELGRKRPRTPQPTVDVDDPNDARAIHEATIRARTTKGTNCTDEVSRRYVLKAFQEQVDGKKAIRKAMEPKDPPPPAPVIDWNTAPDPAAEILGPREVATDAEDGRRILNELLYRKRMRTHEIGKLVGQVIEEKRYRAWGFSSFRELVWESYSVSLRTLESYRDQAADLAIYPELVQALEDGMDLMRVKAVYDIATEDNVGRWLAVAERTTVVELRRAVVWAQDTVGEHVLGTYEHAMSETQNANQFVSVRAARRPRTPPRRVSGVHPDLVRASYWFLENFVVPKQSGFEKVKEDQRWTCENPRCFLESLGCMAHHFIWRSRRGGNEKANARCVCRPCHLRGIHPYEVLEITRVPKGRDLWRYADGLEIVVC